MNFWYNYIIFNRKCSKTYIGSTVHPTRRFRQHNGEIKGGAKYTRGGVWEPYIILGDLLHTKNTALSYEWHLKRESNKIKNKNSKIRRKKGLEKYIEQKCKESTKQSADDKSILIDCLQKNNLNNQYRYLLFVNNKFKYLTPILQSQVIIFYLNPDEFKSEIIQKYIEIVKNINKIRLDISS
jgi:predicted GIY-YIG superfamily endonuclease